MIAGIAGCGYWGPNLVRCLVETNRCEEVLCYDTSPTAVAKVLQRFPTVLAAGSFDELIARCDAIIIATPVSTHYSAVQQVLRAGKAVLVEKPLAMSSLQSRELVETAATAGATLMVGHTFVYSPPVRKVKDYIDSGVIGDIYFISSSRVNLGIHRKDVDVLWDLAPHDVSILLYWLQDRPCRVSAVGRACIGSRPDIANVHYEFTSGVLANIEISWLAPSKLRRTVIVGSKAMLVYDDTSANEKVKLYDKGVKLATPETFGEYQLTYRTGEILSPNIDATEPLLIETHHFLDCVETRRRPDTDGQMGLDVVLALEAASEAMQGGTVVELPTLPTRFEVSKRFEVFKAA